MASASTRLPNMQASESCRTVLIGDSAVGKSSITIRFIQDNFYENQVPTIGAAFLTRTVRTEDDKVIKLEIWDTAGQERFHSLVPMYYRKARAAIVVFDITDQSTFSGAKRWVKDLQKMADPHMVIALVGNKLDLDDERSVDSDEAESYAADNGLLYMETSAKTNRNIDSLFFSLVSKVSTSKNDGSTNRNVNLHNTDGESSGCWGRDKCIIL